MVTCRKAEAAEALACLPDLMNRRTPTLTIGLLGMAMALAAGSPEPDMGIHSSAANEPGEAHERRPIPSPEELRNLPPDGGADYNRLVFEQSPYLLQHAANPVDWYPWGPEAFEKARREDKPVFLSVGYSTCHWCHVMERESFEDPEVAALLNHHFVCIKVDREERPDVDKIYMDVTQAMTGAGGWPMTVVMTPDKKPFFAGTYFPKTGRFGRPGMLDLVPQLAEAWKSDREKVLQIGEQVTGALGQINAGAPGNALTEAALELAYDQFASRYDPVNGGFSQAPKFPVPQNLLFLLRYWKRTGEPRALEMVEHTLTRMRLGGVYDHVGFGFHRYATDAVWLVPHFEKMLYDQALLAMAYVEAFQATGNPLFARTAREVFDYVLRDMTAPGGGFYSAEDADSEGEEGKFYLWSTAEVRNILGEEEGALFINVYHLEEGGNFLEQSSGEKTGTSIPHQTKTLPELAHELGLEADALRERLESARRKLFAVRERRVHPLKDDKILTDWNGLMIAALAKGAQALNEPAYKEAARKAADFVLGTLRDDNGRLLKRYRQGRAGLPGHLEDYAFLVWGLLDLYEATFEPRYLREAVALNELMLKHFWDADSGGLFLTADDGEQLLVRGKEIYDGAIPSGNSAAALNLLRLARMTGRETYEERAQELMKAFSGTVSRSPSAYALLLTALDFAVGPSLEVVIAASPGTDSARALVRALREPYLPNKVVLFRESGVENPALAELAPFTEAMESLDGKATVYVCRNFACERPTTDSARMLELLTGKTPAR